MKLAVTAVFIPHAGCPHRCSFCDQNAITARKRPPEPAEAAAVFASGAARLPEQREKHPGLRAQMAFFGGSFTAVERGYMISLLEAARPFLRPGGFDSIRVSTRPDAVDGGVLDILEEYGVRTVELGAQSSDDGVLEMNRRGHTFGDTVSSSLLLKERGFELGLQMMTGLYGSDESKDLETARSLIALRPSLIRVYPTAVFRNTLLEKLWKEGKYRPQTPEEAVGVCARILPMCREAGVDVARMGLHSDFAPDAAPVAGAFHPAFGELVMGAVYLDLLRGKLQKLPKGSYTVYVPEAMLSAAAGHRGCNREALRKEGYLLRFAADESVGEYRAVIKESK